MPAARGYFNPRSPHGERLASIPGLSPSRFISIHAPRTGSDAFPCLAARAYSNFNPRSPHGERPVCSEKMRAVGLHFNPRSPHGERQHLSAAEWADFTFQSTLPARGATRYAYSPLRRSAFQSTLPARGATARTPGVRGSRETFQSTLPARGATRKKWYRDATRTFQSTLPARGATFRGGACASPSVDFNPRSPHGERHNEDLGTPCCKKLFQSTLPARGATRNLQANSNGDCPFQSTLPARGATVRDIVLSHVLRISIHAPRTGSDINIASAKRFLVAFQSTLPARGATKLLSRESAQRHNFNPRSPHGERLSGALQCTTSMIFQSTLPARGATLHRRWKKSSRTPFQSTLPARGATYPRHFPRPIWGYFNPRSPHGERPRRRRHT